MKKLLLILSSFLVITTYAQKTDIEKDIITICCNMNSTPEEILSELSFGSISSDTVNRICNINISSLDHNTSLYFIDFRLMGVTIQYEYKDQFKAIKTLLDDRLYKLDLSKKDKKMLEGDYVYIFYHKKTYSFMYVSIDKKNKKVNIYKQ